MNKETIQARQEKMIEMYEAGVRISDIAEALGIKQDSVRHRITCYRKKGLVGKRKRICKLPSKPLKPMREPRTLQIPTDKILSETKCACCGKAFYKGTEWVYKRVIKAKTEYYCSWHCMREAEAAVAVRHKRTGT